MEYWVLKADDGLISISDPCHHHKKRSYSAKPITPTLHYSITPLGRVASRSIFSDPRKEHGINDWHRGPGFRR